MRPSKKYWNFKAFKAIILTTCFLTSVAIIFTACSRNEEEKTLTEDYKIIPLPDKVLKRSGWLSFDNDFWIIADVSDSSTANLAKYLVEEIEKLPGAYAAIADLYSTRQLNQGIKLELAEGISEHSQGYVLTITSGIISIQANTPVGLFYGIQTALSILKEHWDGNSKTAELQKMVIKDQPKYNVRVLKIDSLDQSFNHSEFIAILAKLKFNKLLISEEQVLNFNEHNVQNKFIEITHQPILHSQHIGIKLRDIKKFAEAQSEINSDTIVITFDNLKSLNLEQELITAGNISWRGQISP